MMTVGDMSTADMARLRGQLMCEKIDSLRSLAQTRGVIASSYLRKSDLIEALMRSERNYRTHDTREAVHMPVLRAARVLVRRMADYKVSGPHAEHSRVEVREATDALVSAARAMVTSDIVEENGGPVTCACRGAGCVECKAPTPIGQTCGSCAHFNRCGALIHDLNPRNRHCDFIPSRFSLPLVPAKEPESETREACRYASGCMEPAEAGGVCTHHRAIMARNAEGR